MAIASERALRRCALVALAVSAAEIVALCAIEFSAECSTLSCATDRTELGDRVGTQALTLQAAATVYAWLSGGVAAAWIAADAILLLLLAIVSSDVGRVLHRYVGLAFCVERVLLTISNLSASSSLSYAQFLLTAALRSLSLVFLGGYACIESIPQVCGSLGRGAPRLPPAAVMGTELGFVLCGTGFVALSIAKPLPWRADKVSFASAALGAALNVLAMLLKFSLGSVALLAVACALDTVLAYRLWTSSDGTPYRHSSLIFPVIFVAPSVYLLYGGDDA